MKKDNVFRTLRSVVCYILVFASVVTIFSINGVSADKDENADQPTYLYVEDVKLYENVTRDQALKLAEESGYTLLDNDLNIGNNKGVYLAYKPTEDEKLGITQLTMLEMNVDYQMSNFQDLVNSKIRELYPKAQILQRAAAEFAEKYKAGSYDAQYAYKLLDLLYVDELNMTLAEAIVNGKADADLFNKILVRSTAGFSSAIVHALTIGIADPEEDNWAARIMNAETKNLDVGKDEHTDYDDKYLQLADDAVRTIADFAANYRKAAAREFANNGVTLSDEEFTDCSTAGEVVDKVGEEGVEESDADVMYLLAYNILNNYQYDEQTKLGDYLVAAGEKSYNTVSELRELYPLIEAMTPAQAEMLSVSDFTLSVLYLQNNEDILKADEESFKEFLNLINDYNKAAGKQNKLVEETNYSETVSNKKNAISVWAGVNQAIYDQEVAITDEAIRYNTAGSNYSAFTRDTSLQSYLNKIEAYYNIFMYSTGIITGTAHLIIMFAGYFSLYSAAAAAFALGGAYAILGVLAAFAFVIEIVAIVALVVWIVFQVVSYFWPEDEEDDVGEYTEIPDKIFDVKEITYDGAVHTGYVMYQAVLNQNGECADLNADKGKRWNALYYTNSSDVGSAIRVTDLEDMFIVQQKTYSKTDGYTPVTMLGSNDIANLNANTNKDAIYLLYRNRGATSNTVINEGTPEAAVPEAETPDPEAGMYLETIKLYSATNETAAKALYKKEVNKGYTLIDLNLASGTSKHYTYLAYKLTKNPDEALTDIRVCNAYAADEKSGSSLQIGASSYGLAGNLYNGASLWITSSKTAGTPIMGAPEFLTDMKDAKEGWEPVNLASGGLAYDFDQGKVCDTGQTLKKDSNYGKHIYLYFNPSVKYTSGTKYIGGIAFFETDNEDQNDKYLKDTGYTLINKTNFGCLNHTFYSMEITKDPVTGVDYTKLYMAYTTTYNPYRAIYDLGYYEATTTSTSLNPFFTTMENGRSVAYNSVAMYMSGWCRSCSWLENLSAGKTGNVRAMNSNNAYLSPTLGNVYAYATCSDWSKDPEYSWDLCDMRLKGLYVRGHLGEYDAAGNIVPVESETEKPLVPEDLYLSDRKSSIAGYHPVKNMLDRYSGEEINLAAHTDVLKFSFKDRIGKKYYMSKEERDYSAYLYVRKDNGGKPKYISAVHVCTFTMPELKGSDDEKKAMKNAYANAADDNTRISCLAYVNAEVIDLNLSLKEGDNWKNRKSTHKTTLAGVEDNYDKAKRDAKGSASYISVSRTNNPSEAIRGLLKYKPQSSAEMNNPPASITVGKAKYTLAGDRIRGVDGDYYLYYTTNKGVSPCEPITSISIDHEVIIANASTALTATQQDSQAALAKRSGSANDEYYFHCHYDNTSQKAISKLFVGVGDSAKAAKADLLSQGCCSFINLDMNASGGGKYIYLGYEQYEIANIVPESYTTDAKYQRAFKNEYSDAIKDVVVTVGQPYKDHIDLNGTRYFAVSKTNLNEGTKYGKEIYIYYTRDMNLGKDMIITLLGMAQFERAPQSSADFAWEKLLGTNGKRANLNDGCISYSDGFIKENAVHMFIHRYGNVIKQGAAITGGYVSESEKYGQMYVKKG